MRLTAEELKKHNEKVMKIAELRCEKSEIPGLTVSYPDYMRGDTSKVQLAIPCGVIREKKRKVNAMQVRTGAFVTSLAKEKTVYDDEIGDEFNDHTDYMPFDVNLVSDDGGRLVNRPHALGDNSVAPSEVIAYENIKVIESPSFSKGILDL